MFTRERLTRWTNALRANPEQQISHAMTDGEGRFCCLGKLCDVEGLEPILIGGGSDYLGSDYLERFGYEEDNATQLPLIISKEFGHPFGHFNWLGMPDLFYNGKTWPSASWANDNGVPWPVIADHFDKYYPCSDEQH